jgi:serine/threonine-protein kinase
MASTYADVLLGKLALDYRVVSTSALRECLDAQEAGQRAGVESTLGQVLIKRGYLTHAAVQRLDQWRDYSERARRANLAVQILLRHGRPGETVLRSYYERVQQGAFVEDIGWLLQTSGYLSPQEQASLEAAVAQAWNAMYHREAMELRERLSTASGEWWPGQGLGAAPGAAPAAGGVLDAANPYAAHADRSSVYRAAVAGAHGELPEGTGVYRAASPPGRGHGGQQPASPAAEGLRHTGMHRAQQQPQAGYGGAFGSTGAHPAARRAPGVWDATTANRQAQPHLWPGYGAAATGGYRPAAATGAHRPAPGSPYAPPQYTRPRMQAFDGTGAYAPPAPPYVKPAPRYGAPPPGVPARNRPSPLTEPTCDIPGYERLGRLGRGRLGVTYKARQESEGKVVALRILYQSITESAELVQRFYDELKRTKALAHPNILRFYDGGEANGHLFQAMEFIDGQTVQAQLNLQGSIREAEVLRWAAQIVRAMDHYARRDMVHGDIRPQSIMLTKSRRAVLCELGIGVRAYEEYLRSRHSLLRISPHYISPEQGLGADSFDVRSDIYSLGITMFHALTGRVPFEGANAAVVISKHAREPLPDPRRYAASISSETADLVRKMCAKSPDDRHANPRELLAEIAWVHSERAGGATPIVPLDPPLPEELERVNGDRPPKPGLWRRLLRALRLSS